MKKVVVAKFLLLTILLIGFTSAATCSIQSSCNIDNRVMRMYAPTNSHGALYNQGDYNYFLCCDFTGTHTKNGNNKLIGLDSPTNAHAQIPELSNYGSPVYFGDLTCASNIGSCPSGYSIPMLSLSANTNAHIGGFNDYAQKICCELNCIFTSASWNQSSAVEGDRVQMIIQGTNCNGKSVSFEIYEDDLIGDDLITTITGTFDRDTWVTQWVDDGLLGGDPEYYFKSILSENTAMKITSGLLILSVNYGNGIITGDEECDDGNTISGDGCSSTGIIEPGWSCLGEPSVCNTDCTFTSAEWSSSEVSGGTNVNLNVQGNGYCDGESVKFEVFEKELIGRNPAQTNPANAVFNGNSVTGIWNAEYIDDGFAQGNPEYVFRASLNISSSVEIDDSGELTVLPGSGGGLECSNITSCSNYMASGECVTDSCGVAEGSVEENNPLISCGEEGVSCECVWISDSCGPSYTNVAGDYIVGTCSYNENTDDDCEDGFLSYSWTSSWIWGHSGWNTLDNATTNGPSSDTGDYKLDGGIYYFDPYGKFDGCQDGSNLVECPANIQIGFFGIRSFIIAVIILVVVYFWREMKKKK